MDDSSSDENVEEWILYRDRPEWKDIKPISQDDGPFPVVAIAYSEQYRDVYDYFRGAVAKNEKSERVLSLCKDALTLNPANYSVWQYRRFILKHLNADLCKELDYITEVISHHPKNYQVWHHRRVIVEWYGDGSGERSFTEKMLIADSKNYHAWQHRQWCLTTFGLLDGELTFTDTMLNYDVRNNSAWNHRYFVFSTAEKGFSHDVIDTEVDYIISKLKIAIDNESAWNYLRGILLHCNSGTTRSKILNFCSEEYEKRSHSERKTHLIAFLADSSVEEVENGAPDLEFLISKAVKLYNELALKYDVIRASYWKYVINELMQRFPKLEDSLKEN